MKKIIIAGAGIAGLSFAYECLKKGYKVILVEADNKVGGLAKSIYQNDCFLDIGVHILYLKDKEVYEKVREIVDRKHWVKVIRNGKLYIKGNYIDWPLKYTAIFQFPALTAVKIVWDQLVKKKLQIIKPNYRDELLHLYGPTLYYAFFHPLTEKFLHRDPALIHSDWAFSSLRGATKIEDKSFKKNYRYQSMDITAESRKDFNIFKFILSSLTSKKTEEPFYYFKDGFGVLAEEYRKKIIRMGGLVKTGTKIAGLDLKGKEITGCEIGGKMYKLDKLVWTGNPVDLFNLLGLKEPPLEYLNSKYLYFFLKRNLTDYQVCYYADSDISFMRTSVFSNHSKTIIRNIKVKAVMCLEYSFRSVREMFREDMTVLKKEHRMT